MPHKLLVDSLHQICRQSECADIRGVGCAEDMIGGMELWIRFVTCFLFCADLSRRSHRVLVIFYPSYEVITSLFTRSNKALEEKRFPSLFLPSRLRRFSSSRHCNRVTQFSCIFTLCAGTWWIHSHNPRSCCPTTIYLPSYTSFRDD